MAQMYPQRIPEHVENNPGLEGERIVYRALRDGLSDDYSVLYSAHFSLKRNGGGIREKEVDFLVAHPTRGLLVLEVKGGVISLENGAWFSTDKGGTKHPIHDPCRQACAASHDLRRKLLETPKFGTEPLQLGYAVILPGCIAGDLAKHPSIPKGCLLDMAGLERIGDFIRAAYETHQRDHDLARCLTPQRMNVLINSFAPTYEAKSAMLLNAMIAGEQQVQELSEQQFQLMEFAMGSPRGRISGRAGTGKSVVAIRTAERLAAQGLKTLYVCFNRALAEYLRDGGGAVPENLNVYTFHHLCHEYAEQYGNPLPNPYEVPEDKRRDFYEVQHPEALLKALENPEAPRFDAIIVDEAQDFMDDWWEAVNFAFRDGVDERLYVFHDDAQGIFRPIPQFLKDLHPLGTLRHNFRNSRPVHDLLKTRFAVETISRGRENAPEVVYTEMQDGQKLPSAVACTLRRLIEDEGIPHHRIAVLTGGSVASSGLGNDKHIGGIRVTEDLFTEKAVYLTSIAKFKGLDKEAVILCHLDSAARRDREEVLYVGISRARQYLEIIGAPETIAYIRNPGNAGSS